MPIDKNKVISDSLFLTVCDFLLRFKGVIFIPLIISAVGLDYYGAFVQILINPTLIIPFCALALGMGFYRYTSQYTTDQKFQIGRDFWTVMSISFIISLAGAGILYLLSPIISKSILQGIGLRALRYSSILVINGVMWEVLTKFIQSRKQFKLYSIYELIYGLVPYISFVVGISVSKELFFGIILYILTETVLLLFLFFFVTRNIRFMLPSFSIFVKFLRYSWALLFSQLSGGILSKIDRYFIGYFLGPTSIGIYNIVYSVSQLLPAFAKPFGKYFDVYLPKHWDEGNYDKVKSQIREGLLYYLIITIGGLIGITLYLRPAIIILLGKTLSGVDHFEFLVFVTALGLLLFGTTEFYNKIVRYMEKNQFQLIFQLVAAFVNIILNFFLVRTLGILGAGIATFISYGITIGLYNTFFTIDANLNYFVKIFGIILATFPMIIIYHFIKSPNMVSLIASMFFSAIVFVLIIFVLRILTIKKIITRFT